MTSSTEGSQPCIVGITRTTPSGGNLEESLYRTVRDLLDAQGLTLDVIDHIAIASSDGIDGRAISSMVTGPAVGVYGRDYINSSSSGEHGLILACLRIMAGRSHTVLTANWGHPSEAPVDAVQRLELEPFFHRALGANHAVFLGLQASAYLSRAGVDPAIADEVLRKNGVWRDGGDEMVAWPLRERHLPPRHDGAVALLVTSTAWAREHGLAGVRITGMGWTTGSFWDRGAALSRLGSLFTAGTEAYKRAGIAGVADADLVEITDLTPFHELMAYEALGLCPEGEAPALLASGDTAPDGRLPVNASGGLQVGVPPFAHGLDRVAVAAQALLNGRGTRAVAHAASGPGAQNNSVFILERSDHDA